MSRAAKETITTKQPIVYSDFMNNLDLHPLSGDVAKVTNAESIKQSIRNLIIIGYGEKLFNPTIGSNVYQSLFEPIDGFTINDIQDHITDTIGFHEPRVNLLQVVVSPNPRDDNAVTATIAFNIINTGEIATLNLILTRVR